MSKVVEATPGKGTFVLGGICPWKIELDEHGGVEFTTTCEITGYYSEPAIVDDFKYCPYCGKSKMLFEK